MSAFMRNVLILALFFIILSSGRGETKHLTVKDDGTVKLQTKEGLKLKGDFQILWYVTLRGQNETLTLVYVDSGNWTHHPPAQFKHKLDLNETSGGLTLGPLSIGDSGVYYGDIVEENSGRYLVEYNITVEVTAGPSRNTTNDPPKVQRNHIAAIATGSIIGIVCIIGLSAIVYKAFILIKAKMEEKKKGKIQSTEMSVI